MGVQMIVESRGKQLVLTGRQIDALIEIYTKKSGKTLSFAKTGNVGLDTILSVATAEINRKRPSSFEKNFVLRLKKALELPVKAVLIPNGSELITVLRDRLGRFKVVKRIPYVQTGDYLMSPVKDGVVLAGGQNGLVARFGYRELHASDPFDGCVRAFFGGTFRVVEHTNGYQIIEKWKTGTVAYGWQKGVGNYAVGLSDGNVVVFVPGIGVRRGKLPMIGFEEPSDVRLTAEAMFVLAKFVPVAMNTPVWEELSPIIGVMRLVREKKRGKAVLKDKIKVFSDGISVPVRVSR